MNERSSYIFVEGETEARLLKKMGCTIRPHVCRGSPNMPDEIKKSLEDELENFPIGVLILRDRDHDETHNDIINSFEYVINNLLQKSDLSQQSFKQHPQFKNLYLYTMNVSSIDFRAALHIAAPPPIDSIDFNSDTIDGYILALAMNKKVLMRFANDAKIDTNVLRNKVLKEVPKLANDNGIKFDQAKDFLGVYMAMSKFLTKHRNEKEDVFSGIVADRAKKHDNEAFQEIFRSIQMALRFIEVDV